MSFTPEKMREITIALQEHGANKPCPQCGTLKWTLLDRYLCVRAYEELDKPPRDDQVVPTICRICDHCGFLALHAPGALGILHHPLEPPADQQHMSQHSISNRTTTGFLTCSACPEPLQQLDAVTCRNPTCGASFHRSCLNWKLAGNYEIYGPSALLSEHARRCPRCGKQTI
jgi:predicted RNA-binding Zn-ribbon protein involved in translation (DUF1610 family)